MAEMIDRTTQHTPGPWIARQGADCIWVGPPKPFARDDCYNIVASLEGGSEECRSDFNERQRANARLIAAAPRMLGELTDTGEGRIESFDHGQTAVVRLLREAAKYLGELGADSTFTAMLEMRADSVQAAIAKATGSADVEVDND